MGDASETSSPVAQAILGQLQRVDAEQAARAREPGLAAKVMALKHYQQRRLELSHAALLRDPRYNTAARFFLDELYGPSDFRRRDAQFARVVPALVRLFPAEVVATVAQLAELHALSEQLDSAMARCLPGPVIDAPAYRQAWLGTGSPAQREQQIALLLAIGGALDRLTRKPLLRQALRLMRGPAAAAGLADLQQFLERGFDTFKAMKGAEDFLQQVATRERALSAALFAPAACPPGDDLLGQLP